MQKIDLTQQKLELSEISVIKHTFNHAWLVSQAKRYFKLKPNGSFQYNFSQNNDYRFFYSNFWKQECLYAADVKLRFRMQTSLLCGSSGSEDAI